MGTVAMASISPASGEGEGSIAPHPQTALAGGTSWHPQEFFGVQLHKSIKSLLSVWDSLLVWSVYGKIRYGIAAYAARKRAELEMFRKL